MNPFVRSGAQLREVQLQCAALSPQPYSNPSAKIQSDCNRATPVA